jgi:LAS superfamily LD-carboxypeptidase LdcB
MRRPSLSARVLTAVALVVTTLVVAAPGAGAAGKDPRQQRREVQKKKAEVASQIDVLKASDAQVAKALDALEANVKSQTAKVAAARQASAVATQRAAEAKQAEERTTAKLGGLRTSLQETAVNAYIQGPTARFAVAFEAADLNEASRRNELLRVAVGQGTDVADELRATKEDLGIKRAAADAAQQRAQQQRRQVEADLADLKQAESAQQKVADGVESRLNAALAEAQSLEAVDQALAAQIAAQQAALARRLAARAPAGGTFSGTRRFGSVSVTSVRGIVVNVAIASQVEALLAAAEADGFALSGGGYRDPEQQVALRRAHCGSSDYAIYDAPASSCHPPTARPGSSMHEQGLAIDFTSGGSIISSRSNPAYQWLARNASRFGLYNLPAEPWHWSTNGN